MGRVGLAGYEKHRFQGIGMVEGCMIMKMGMMIGELIEATEDGG